MRASQISSLDQVLWRIAELGHRYADPAFQASRRQIWAELEAAVAEAQALAEAPAADIVDRSELESFAHAATAAETARLQAEAERDAAEEARREAEARSEAMVWAMAKETEIRGRLQTERRETRRILSKQKATLARADQELEAARQTVADAPTARREAEAERDAAVEALEVAVAAARREAEAERDAAWEALVAAADTGRREAEAERDAAREAMTSEVLARREAEAEREIAREAFAAEASARREAEAERDAAVEALGAATDAARQELEAEGFATRREAEAERDAAREAFASEAAARRRVEGERDAATAAMIAAQTEREAARAALSAATSERDAARAALSAAEAAAGFTGPDELAVNDEMAPAEVDISEPDGWEEMVPALPEDGQPFQYLHVGATLAGLLPDDLTPLLVKGASVVRREGRISALLAVRCEAAGESVPSPEWEEQAARLRARDLMVGWADEVV